jgi:hypothetical protein
MKGIKNMTYPCTRRRILPPRILRSQLIKLALISLSLIAVHATPAGAQQPWSTPDPSGNINSTNTGNIGIGTTNPGFPLHVEKNQNGATGVFVFNTTNGTLAQAGGGVSRTTNFSDKYFTWGVTAPLFSGVGYQETGYFHTKGIPIKFGTMSAHNLYFFTDGITNTRMAILSGGNVGINNPNPIEKLDVVGNIKVTGNIDVSGNINAKYQDVAEWVPTSEQIPAGTVVVLDSTKSNHVIASTTGYDTRVAGVISEQPGIALGERGDNKVLVATTGRVKLKVDATRGAIEVGDLLVTSDVPGRAMKSKAIEVGGVQIHRPGTLLGKALEPLDKGQGQILVLLSLQ